jgi:hypothetical protein
MLVAVLMVALKRARLAVGRFMSSVSVQFRLSSSGSSHKVSEDELDVVILSSMVYA